jgi:hypothetical protein
VNEPSLSPVAESLAATPEHGRQLAAVEDVSVVITAELLPPGPALEPAPEPAPELTPDPEPAPAPPELNLVTHLEALAELEAGTLLAGIAPQRVVIIRPTAGPSSTTPTATATRPHGRAGELAATTERAALEGAS